MPCTVVRTEHGYLQYRLRSKAIPGYECKESSGIPDDREHRDQRRQMERRAKLMSAEMAAGKFDYLAWFPSGSKAAHFQTKVATTTVGEYITRTWLPRKQPPLVRFSTANTYAKHVRCHIEPQFGDSRFGDVTVAALEDFRALLIMAEAQGGKGLALKTARDVIDGTFRAIYRDARKVGLADGDPFAALDWPDKVVPEPDPFTPAERDTLLERLSRRIHLEHGLLLGLGLVLAGAGVLLAVFVRWAHAGFGRLGDEYPTALGVTLAGLGVQTIFGSFFISLLTMRSGRDNEAPQGEIAVDDRAREPAARA